MESSISRADALEMIREANFPDRLIANAEPELYFSCINRDGDR